MADNSGPYVGLGITHDNLATGGDIEGLGFNGIGGTVFAGFNVPLSEKAFAGLELNFDLLTAKVGDDTDAVKADNAFGVSARLGANLNDNSSLYFRGGWQRGKAGTLESGASYSDTRNGLRLGAGIETSLSSSMRLRFEYNRTHYYMNDEDKDLLEPLTGSINNDQFVAGLVIGF
jgi:outer membrane immunogenic protein